LLLLLRLLLLGGMMVMAVAITVMDTDGLEATAMCDNRDGH